VSAFAALPRLNHPAPDFEAQSTQGPLRLGDFAGKWLILFAHPADFTPVCTSEIVAFGRASGQFAALNCRLLGLSVDSVYSHLAWRENIRQHFGVSIDFPIIEDVSLEISRRYGMVDAQAQQVSDVRALFIIDPQGLMRAMLYYPPTTGRSVSEVLRLLQALQISDRDHVVTPEGWQPGQETVEPAPRTIESSEARRNVGQGCVDWYYYKRAATQDSKAAQSTRHCPQCGGVVPS
jgi:peroxiredoxin (alkyl hydroperoxide reductase subunit C)